MRIPLLWLAAAAALAAGPESVERRKAGARALLDRHDFAAALKEARAANREYPDDVDTYRLMAAAHLGLGEYDEAEKALQWMLDLRIGKADAAGWAALAEFRAATGDVEGALEAVNFAYARLAPGDDRERARLMAYAAHLNFVAGRFAIAEHAAKGSSEPLAVETLALVRVAQGRRDEAVRALRSIAAPEPRHLYLLAEVSGAPEDWSAFEREALRRTGRPDNADRELVLYWAGPGKRPADALALARKARARQRDVYTLDALAVALFAAGEKAEARDVMRQALAVGVRDPAILAHAARLGVKPE